MSSKSRHIRPAHNRRSKLTSGAFGKRCTIIINPPPYETVTDNPVALPDNPAANVARPDPAGADAIRRHRHSGFGYFVDKAKSLFRKGKKRGE